MAVPGARRNVTLAVHPAVGILANLMSTVSSKVRLYALAKELNIDMRRLIEEARREGARFSVASNQVSKAVADKIRDRFRTKRTPAEKEEPRNLTHKPFARLVYSADNVQPVITRSVNPLKQLIPILSKPAKTYDAVAKKPRKKVEKRFKVKPKTGGGLSKRTFGYV